MKRIVLILLVCATGLTSWSHAEQSTQQEKDAIYAATKGHGALVLFWRPDCPPCIDELRILPTVVQAHPQLKIVLVSLSERTAADQRLTSDLPKSVMNLTLSHEPKELLAAFGDQHEILPFSARLHRDGQICQIHVGILGTNLVNQWEKIC